MATIPQYTREKLVSPVVGTPGIDTSGAAIEQSFASGAEAIAAPLFDKAIKIQQSKDEAEANTLMTQYKISTINTLEQHKVDYASQPDKSAPVFHQAMTDNLAGVVGQASNDRVKLMVQKGDPYFDGHMAMQQGAWASQQEQNNVFHKAVSDVQSLGVTAGKIGENQNLTLDQQKEQLLPLASALGNTVNSLKASKRPDLADKIGTKGMESVYKGWFYGALKNDPVKALEVLQDPDFQKSVPSKDIDTFQKAAEAGLKSFNENQRWKDTANDLVKYPDLVTQVRNGRIGWGDLDQMEKQQGSKPMFSFLKDMAFKLYPDESAHEQAPLQVQFYDEAHKLGFDIPKGTPSNNVRALMKFNDDLMSARQRGLISAETFNRINDKLATPLAGAVLKTHDPNWFDQLKQSGQSVWSKMTGHPEEAVDRYNGGYGAIDTYLKTTGVDKSSAYFKTKSALLDEYFKQADTLIGNPQVQRPQGGPYTAVDVAHKVMGIEFGSLIKTSLGMRRINGYKSPGVPTVETTKEDDELLKGPLNQLQKKGP